MARTRVWVEQAAQDAAMTPADWLRRKLRLALEAARRRRARAARKRARGTRVPWALAAALAVLPCADAATDPSGLSARATAGVTVLPNDRDALIALYHATGGPDWDRSDFWLTDRPLSLWYGVTANSAGRVERLEPYDNDLSGPIPPEIGNLATLQILRFEDNELSGPIPPEIGKLAALETLHLAFSGLSGPIPPEIGKLAALQHLDLTGMSGPIPPEMANLAALQWLRPLVGPGPCVHPDSSPRLLAWLAALNVNPPRCAGGG